MSEGIIIALITGGLTFAGVIISNVSGNKKVVNKVVDDIKLELVKYQAVTDEKITELTREVRKHNGFAERIPKLEEQVVSINKRIDYLQK